MSPSYGNEPKQTRDNPAESKLPLVRPETPRHAHIHQKVIRPVCPGWMKFALLGLAIALFILAMFLFR
jgi:hypothetical protein